MRWTIGFATLVLLGGMVRGARAQEAPSPAQVASPAPAFTIGPPERPRGMPLKYRLLTSGATLFSTVYTFNIIAAAASKDSASTATVWPLYVPVIGPFMQMGYTQSEGARVALAFDGLAQAGGIALLIGAVVMPEPRPGRPTVVPLTLPGGSGVGLLGRF